MVSVLALNRLELREMINQEIMANPVLDEATEDDGVTAESYTDEAFLKKETEKVPEVAPANPFDEFDFGSFFTQYLDSGAERISNSEREEIEKAFLRQISFFSAESCRPSQLAAQRQHLHRDCSQDCRIHRWQSGRKRIPHRLAR